MPGTLAPGVAQGASLRATPAGQSAGRDYPRYTLERWPMRTMVIVVDSSARSQITRQSPTR